LLVESISQTAQMRYTCEPCDAPSADPACVRISATAAKQYAPHTTFGSVDELLALYRPALNAATNAADSAATGTAVDVSNTAAADAAAAAVTAGDQHSRQLQAATAVNDAPAADEGAAVEVLDVILLYTTALKNKLGDQGIKALLASSVAQSNLVYANCGIPLTVRVSSLVTN
jgi:hypothetical protein